MNDSAISLADARPLVASPLWPRIRAFLWNFASLCDPARLTAAAGGSGGAAPRSLDLLGSPRVAASALRALLRAQRFGVEAGALGVDRVGHEHHVEDVALHPIDVHGHGLEVVKVLGAVRREQRQRGLAGLLIADAR